MSIITNSKYILDTSVVATTLLPDEKSLPQAKKFLKVISNRQNLFYSHKLIKLEFCNTLRSAVIQKRINTTSTYKLLQNFQQIPIKYLNIKLSSTLNLALTHNLSFYDATYLHLSLSFKIPLLTLDNKLKKLSFKP